MQHLIHCKTTYKIKYTMREQIVIFVVCITRRNDSHVDSMTNGLLLLKLMPGYCFPDTKEWKYRIYFCRLTLLLSGNGRPMAIERTRKKNELFVCFSQQSHVIPFTKPMQAMMCPLLLYKVHTAHMQRQLPIAKEGLTNHFLIQLSRYRETKRGVPLFQKLIWTWNNRTRTVTEMAL